MQVDNAGKAGQGGALLGSDPANPILNPIDCKVGPDGALYFLGWSDNGAYPHNAGHGNLVKLEYTGPQTHIGPMGEHAANTQSSGWTLLAPGVQWAPPSAASILRARAFDARGRQAWTWTQGAPESQPRASAQMLRVRMELAKGL